MTTDNFETIIIGSGVAATALTYRLLCKNPNASILILEAGQKVKMQDAAIWQDYILSGKLPYEKYYDLDYPDRDRPGENINAGKTTVPLMGSRVITYGGSTIHWGGWSFRLKPEDFRLYSNTGSNLDWPFNYNELEPYYCEAEHYIGVSGDSEDPTVPRSQTYPFSAFPYTWEDKPVAEAMRASGIAYSHLPIARRGITNTVSRHAPCQTTGTCKYCPFGARFSANNFLDDMLDSGSFPNLEVRLNSVVEKVVMSECGNIAKGVAYFENDNKTRNNTNTLYAEAERIIIAAGTIESSKLLLRSKYDKFWRNGIGNDRDLVGANLVTHPYFIFTGQRAKNSQLEQSEMNFPTLCSRHFDSEEEQAEGKFILINPPSSPKINLLSKMQAGLNYADINNYIEGENWIELHGMVEIFSERNNRISNFDKINKMGMPQTLVDFSQSYDFDRRMKYIQKQVKKIFNAMDASLIGKPSISWRADHAACTLRMSDSETFGVTDPDMRVHGVDNLYVCSNASFPSTGAVNPTLTLTALALRLGDHLNKKTNAQG
ncbi:MAG TPA: GMC family oxidoreductase [Cyanobacteria bacterium UBA8803]|nr:GMC family oxidoreductase [Cyanobacteria bacterium UBA9273]HBL59722.1 GMC family oxidoreductase [Cyanobacteria bacterium UBA8803]